MAWIPPNYKSKSASKDHDNEEGFKFKKKKPVTKSSAKVMTGFKEIKKLK
jgi:hypothetical protein